MPSAFTMALKPRPSPPTERKPKTRTAGELKPAHTALFSSRFVQVLYIQDQNQQLFITHRYRPLFAPHSLLAGFADCAPGMKCWAGTCLALHHGLVLHTNPPPSLLQHKRENTPMKVQFMCTPQPLWSAEADVFWERE